MVGASRWAGVRARRRAPGSSSCAPRGPAIQRAGLRRDHRRADRRTRRLLTPHLLPLLPDQGGRHLRRRTAAHRAVPHHPGPAATHRRPLQGPARSTDRPTDPDSAPTTIPTSKPPASSCGHSRNYAAAGGHHRPMGTSRRRIPRPRMGPRHPPRHPDCQVNAMLYIAVLRPAITAAGDRDQARRTARQGLPHLATLGRMA